MILSINLRLFAGSDGTIIEFTSTSSLESFLLFTTFPMGDSTLLFGSIGCTFSNSLLDIFFDIGLVCTKKINFEFNSFFCEFNS